MVPSVRDGVATLDQTTIDYALVEMNAMNLVRKLTILEETELSPVMSDHRPLLLELNWINNFKAPARSNVAARRCLRLHGRSRHLLNSFEDRLEPQLVQLNAQVEESSIAERWSELKVLFLRAADDHFGTRLIGHASKAWVGGDMKVLFQIRKLARLVSKAACQHDETLALAARELMDDVTKLLKATQRSKRKAKNLAAFREIEAAHGRSNLFWSKWKSRVGSISTKESFESVINDQGAVTSDPLQVLQEKIGKTFAR